MAVGSGTSILLSAVLTCSLVGPTSAGGGAPAGGTTVPAPSRWAAGSAPATPGLRRHIQPLLGKAGCTNRACHGSFQGRGGLRFSLFSSDADLDRAALQDRKRLDSLHPAQSLLVRKPTGQVRHGGGVRFVPGSWQHRMLLAWLSTDARTQSADEPDLLRLELNPTELTLRPGSRVGLRVRAHFSDGTNEDVTALTQFSTNDDGVAKVSDSGEVSWAGPGDTALVLTYGGGVETIPVLNPRLGAAGRAAPFPAHNPIDLFVGARLRTLRIEPSVLCTDLEFLRRASLDITGSLPTADEVRRFEADTSPGKRTNLVDDLLRRPTHAAWWTTRLCDLTGLNAPLFLGNTDFGPQVGAQWHAWVLRRVRENVGYDRLVEGIVLARSRRPGETYEEYVLRCSSYLKSKDPTDFTAQDRLPNFWFRSNLREPEEKALGFAYSFLGLKLDCAQCHKHPFDVWTQRDFQQFAALFSRIKTGIPPDARVAHQRLEEELGVKRMKDTAERRQTYWRLAALGRAVPWQEVFLEPAPAEAPAARILGGPRVDLRTTEDPRTPLMAWLRDPKNPFFAAAYVNRVWTHYFGRGLYDPTDEMSRANPPRNRPLMEYLVRRFIDTGYDMRWLHREIATSRTYQLSFRPTPSNRADTANFSHAMVRRLPAEVAVDAVQIATASSGTSAAAAADHPKRRISAQATADERRTEFGLVVFGKPLRKATCDCERDPEPSLLQALYLRNDPDFWQMVDRPDGWLREILAGTSPPGELVQQAYLKVLSRRPTARERDRALKHLAGAANRADGFRDLLWALLNTREFITSH